MKRIYLMAAGMLACTALFSQTDSASFRKGNELQEIVVSGVKASERIPVTQTTLKKEQIEERYYGADTA